ncbi:helix-turn-helix transcriptional regulator [Actinocorallia lasiicapitis]
MSDIELAAFLRSRREALTPSDVGLPSGQRRRTPGLRRSEVAQLSGVSVEYLTRLEQGRDRNPSPQVLGALADALRLSPDERTYLRFAAKAASGGDSLSCCPGVQPPVQEIRPTVRALFDRLDPAPAILLNRLGEVLTCTDSYRLMAGPIVESGNFNRYLFASPTARATHPDWDRAADDAVTVLRHGNSPADPHLLHLVDELTVTGGSAFSDRFRRPIAASPIRNGVERLIHPSAGELRLAYETLLFLDEDLRAIVYFPADPTTDTALSQLTHEPLRVLTA